MFLLEHLDRIHLTAPSRAHFAPAPRIVRLDRRADRAVVNPALEEGPRDKHCGTRTAGGGHVCAHQAAAPSPSVLMYLTTASHSHGFANMAPAPASLARMSADPVSPVMTITSRGPRAAETIAPMRTSPGMSGRPRSLTSRSKR